MLDFIAGACFALGLHWVSMRMASAAYEHKEEIGMRREEKKKILARKAQGAVVRPKTPEQVALEKDEERQAFLDILNNT